MEISSSSHVALPTLYTLGAYISCSSPEIINCSSSRKEGRQKVGRTQSILKHCSAGWPLHLFSPGLYPWVIPALVEVGLSYLHQDVKSLPNLQTDPKAFFLNESCLTNLTLMILILVLFPALVFPFSSPDFIAGRRGKAKSFSVFFDLAILKSVS